MAMACESHNHTRGSDTLNSNPVVTLKEKTPVTAYLKSTQLLLFVFAYALLLCTSKQR